MSKRECAMSSEEIARRRIPMAYHEAGHTIMGYWVGCDLAAAGVVVDMAQKTFQAVIRTDKLPVKERVMMVLAGHLAAHHWMVSENGERVAREWHEIGGPKPLTKDEFLETYFAACIDTKDGISQRDDWKLATMMVGGELDTEYNARSLDRFKARCLRYQNEALKQIRLPLVWRSITKIADALLTRDNLAGSECMELLSKDFDALKGGYQRQGGSL